MPQAKPVSLADALRACYEGQRTQVELAEALGKAQRTISSWVTGTREPSLDDIRDFESACGRPLGWVLTMAGFVSQPTTPEEAVELDTRIGDPDRRIILDVIEGAVARAAKKRRG
jgi:transcriptional regulator with XRE-family HTH domain